MSSYYDSKNASKLFLTWTIFYYNNDTVICFLQKNPMGHQNVAQVHSLFDSFLLVKVINQYSLK